jgi:hypothetical protein
MRRKVAMVHQCLTAKFPTKPEAPPAIFADRHLSQTAPEVTASGIPVFFKVDHIADLSEKVRAIPPKGLVAHIAELSKKYPDWLIRNSKKVVATKGVKATP